MADAKIYLNGYVFCLGNVVLITDTLLIVQPEKVFKNEKNEQSLRIAFGLCIEVNMPMRVRYHGMITGVSRDLSCMLIFYLKNPLDQATGKSIYER